MVLLRAYVALMKLRVVELLLISTIPAMILAEKGVPSLGLIAAT
jgi:protoheme IX farnesyltransferase